jgi:hypothetical protein
MVRTIIVLAVSGLSATAAVSGVPNASPPPGLVKDLSECRHISDLAARVACYDRRVDQLDAETKSGDLVILDREQVHTARRSLFGFTVPRLPFLEGSQDHPGKEAKPANEIETTIRSARSSGMHEWTIVLEDGAVWQTNEAPVNDPRRGDKIRIKRAALGSYLANIAGQRAVRIRRVG